MQEDPNADCDGGRTRGDRGGRDGRRRASSSRAHPDGGANYVAPRQQANFGEDP